MKLNNKLYLEPQTFGFPSSDDSIKTIFCAPGNTSIGIVTQDEKFYIANTSQQTLELDYLENAPAGNESFSWKPLSDHEIGYVSGNGFIVYNLKDRQYTCFDPVDLLEEDIVHFYEWNSAKRQFIFDVRPQPRFKILSFPVQPYNDENDPESKAGKTETVAVVDKAGEEYNPTAGLAMRFLGQWAIRDNVMFFADETSLSAYDATFLKRTNIVCETFNNAKSICIIDAIIHPKLPFALFYCEHNLLLLVRCEHPDENERVAIFPLHALVHESIQIDAFLTANYMLSPNGNWIVFRDDSIENNHPSYYALPVKEDNPLYIGKPVYLGKCIHDDTEIMSTTWMDDEAKFAAADDKTVYIWDLAKVKLE